MLNFRFPFLNSPDWAVQTFGAAPLGDVRRSQRAAKIAQAMVERSGASIPEMFSRQYDVKAAYTLFDRPESTPDALQKAHRDQVLEEARRPGWTVLLIQDTSEMIWSGHAPVAGLGPVGAGQDRHQGFLLHSALAVRWPGLPALDTARRPPLEVLGLADQRYEIRKERPAGERKGDSKGRKERARESHLWQTQTGLLGLAPEGVRCVVVNDRGGDIYEHLRGCIDLGYGYVVRAAQNRALIDEADKLCGYLFETARAAAPLGDFDLPLRGRNGKPERVVRLSLAAASVCIRAPQRPGHGPGALPPINCTVVRVFEAQPPAGAEPLEWILLTDRPVETFDAALEIALQYSARWLIEEFHKVLKTCMGAETLQLQTADRLFAAIAIMSMAALRVLTLREAGRECPDAPAQEVVSEVELEILRLYLKRPIHTVREAVLAIGRLGGHMNRPSDGMPGIITLWRGLNKLKLLVQGFMLADQLPKFGV